MDSISEQRIQKAFDWLTENAEKAAQARAERIYMEEYKKTVLALEMKASGEKTVAAQEVAALVSDPYRNHLLGLQEAVRVDELYRWRQRTADALIDAWRSIQANHRSQGKI